MYKLIIFDWDGTVVDSIRLITQCITEVAKEFKVKTPSPEAIFQFIGNNTGTDLLEIFPNIAKEKAVACYEKHYFYGKHRERLVPGALATLKVIKSKGMQLAIATNKTKFALERSLHNHKLDGFFSTIRTADSGYVKPQAAMALSIVAELKMQPEHALIVGDSHCDMLLAKNAGIDSIAITYGLYPKEILLQYSPIACIDRIKQLLDFI